MYLGTLLHLEKPLVLGLYNLPSDVRVYAIPNGTLVAFDTDIFYSSKLLRSLQKSVKDQPRAVIQVVFDYFTIEYAPADVSGTYTSADEHQESMILIRELTGRALL